MAADDNKRKRKAIGSSVPTPRKQVSVLALTLCLFPLCAFGQDNALILWDESVDGDLPFNFNALTEPERARFTFVLSADRAKVVGHSRSGETFVVVVPQGRELVQVMIRFNNTITNNSSIFLIEPYPYGSGTNVCMASQTHIAINSMPKVSRYFFPITFAAAGPPAAYYVGSTMAVMGLSIPAAFEIEFVVADAPIFQSGFSCRQFPAFPGE